MRELKAGLLGGLIGALVVSFVPEWRESVRGFSISKTAYAAPVNQYIKEYAVAQAIVDIGGCVPGGACSVASLASSGAVSGTTFSASSTTSTNFSCSANSSTICLNPGSGRVGAGSTYFTFGASNITLASVSSDGLITTGVAAPSGQTLRLSGSIADSANNTNFFFLKGSSTADTNVNKFGFLYLKSNAGADRTFGVTSVHGGVQMVGIANASLPTCNSDNINTSGGTLGRIYYDTTNNVLVVCNGTAWKTITFNP